MNEVLTEALRRQRCRVGRARLAGRDIDWSSCSPLPALTTPWRHVNLPPTVVRAVFDDTGLHVRFDCTIVNPALLGPVSAGGGLGQAETVRVKLHPGNDPGRAITFRADYRGLHDATAQWQSIGECSLGGVPDTWQKSATFRGRFSVQHGFFGPGYFVCFTIPWRTLGVDPVPSVLGFGFGRLWREVTIGSHFADACWPDSRASLLEHGELLLGEQADAPATLRFEGLSFGASRATLVLGSDWRRVGATLGAEVVRADGRADAPVSVGLPDHAGEVPFTFRLDRALSSYVHKFAPPRLRLTISDAGGEVYRALLPMDRHLGYTVDEPYGVAAMTAGADHASWLRRVVGALPRLHRVSTPAGAPSDFCLAYAGGKVVVNLMADDAWPALARIVTERFGSAADRMVAALALVGQKSVTNLLLEPMFQNLAGEQSYHTPLHEVMGPLSLLRHGGGPAVCRAAVLARLLQEIADPQTGLPFVTRVVSLFPDGGPRQATDQYRAAAQCGCPLVLEPGPIGMVAVDWRGSQTLLDPSALLMFPDGKGDLATVEQIVSDNSIRAVAGRLADAVAKLDIDEMRRQRPNALLSRGVFPELGPEEEGRASAFDLGFHQTPRCVVVGAGAAGELTGLIPMDTGASLRRGSVRIQRDGTALRIVAQIRGVGGQELDDADRRAERVHVLIDPHHDHENLRHFAVSLSGTRLGRGETYSTIQTLFKHYTTECATIADAIDPGAWRATVEECDDGYDAIFDLPAAVLGDQIAEVIGLNVWVDCRRPYYQRLVLCRPRYRLGQDGFGFADVYLPRGHEAPAVTVDGIDFGVLYWGDNKLRVMLNGDASAEVTCETWLPGELGPRWSGRVKGTGEMLVPCWIDPGLKMGAGESQRMVLRVEAGGAVAYRGSWSVNYCGLLTAYQPDGEALGDAPAPRRGSADYAESKLRHIGSQLPRFVRRTTREGAASDFVIEAEDGSVSFNLMQAGVLAEVGRWIASRFDSDVDRVLGLFCLAHQPAWLRHMSFGHRIMTGAGPLSILRANHAGGGGNCGYHSRAFAGMLCHLPLRDGLAEAHTLGVWGHSVTGMAWRGSKHIIDNDVCHVLLDETGEDLMTIDQMRAGMTPVTTAGPIDLTRYYTFHDESLRAQQGLREYPWPGTFPPGAATSRTRSCPWRSSPCGRCGRCCWMMTTSPSRRWTRGSDGR